MVNTAVSLAKSEDPRGSERALAIRYAPTPARRGLAALLALDDRLGQIVAHTREPLVAQMRLTWWHDALRALADRPPPAEPLLRRIAADVVANGIVPDTLAGIVDGWELLLDEDPIGPLLEQAARRGAGLFAIAQGLGAADTADPISAGGEGWALADIGRRSVDPARRQMARALAEPRVAEALGRRWSRAGRGLGALVLLARADLDRPDRIAGAPRDVARLLAFRLTGR